MTARRAAALYAAALTIAALGALAATAIRPWHGVSFGKSWFIDTLLAGSVLVALLPCTDQVLRRRGW